MRKKYLFAVFSFAAIFILENCKREPTITTKTSPNDPDSLYIGTKYTLPSNLYRFPEITNAYADSMTYEGVALGRRLFYDKHLSVNGQKACASCHYLQHAFSDSGFALSTNEFGHTRRNTPSLQNLAWAPYYFWDGRAPTLAAQADNAAHNEMGILVANSITYLQKDSTYLKLFKKAFGRPGTISETEIYKAIQQFLMTAISANSRFDQFLQGQTNFTPSEENGYQLFITETGDCFHCHMSGGGVTLLMTDNLFHNNGLDSAAEIGDFNDPGRGGITGLPGDYGKFKSPSLRNIALNGPYMHDGRYKTLMQVINFYSDSTRLSPTIDALMLYPNHHYGKGLQLAQSQKNDLLNFLYTLTDTSFINNPNLTSPF